MHVKRCAFSNLFTVVEYRHAVTQAHHQFHVVLNQQDGAVVFADLVDQFAQLHFFSCVHASGGLIKGNQLGVCGQGACNLQPALVAVAQGAGFEVSVFADAHIVQQLIRAFGNRGFFLLEASGAKHGPQQTGVGADMPADHDVFKRRHLGE